MQSEARPRFDGKNTGERPSMSSQSATVSRVVVSQSGAGTNGRVTIVTSPCYTSNGYALAPSVRNIVFEVCADLLADAAEASARVNVYHAFYVFVRCARSFVAMRLEWTDDGPAPQ